MFILILIEYVPPLRHGGGTVVSTAVSVEMNPFGVKLRPWRTNRCKDGAP